MTSRLPPSSPVLCSRRFYGSDRAQHPRFWSSMRGVGFAEWVLESGSAADDLSRIDDALTKVVAAGFNNVFLYFAMLPRIWAEHGAPLVRYDA